MTAMKRVTLIQSRMFHVSDQYSFSLPSRRLVSTSRPSCTMNCSTYRMNATSNTARAKSIGSTYNSGFSTRSVGIGMMPPLGRNSKSSRTEKSIPELALKHEKSMKTARVARSTQPCCCSAAAASRAAPISSGRSTTWPPPE